MSLRKRTFGLAAAATALAMAAATSPAAAAGIPAPKGSHASIQVVDIAMSATQEFTAPTKLHAGWINFRVSTTDSGYHGFEVVRVNPGHTLQEVLDDLTLGLSGDLASNAQGARQLVEDGTLMGGIVPTPYAPQEAILPLTRGTYYMFDFANFGLGTPVPVHTLKVVGNMNKAAMPHFDSVVDMVMSGEDPRFVSPSSFDANSSILMRVEGDEIHEAVFRATRAGVTDEYITEYYDAVLAGGPLPGPSPWTDIQRGFNAMSPGQIAIYHMNLAPGSYALACYVPSDETGLPHAYMGMHKMVTLH